MTLGLRWESLEADTRDHITITHINNVIIILNGTVWENFGIWLKNRKSSTSNDFASLSVDKLYDYSEKKFSCNSDHENDTIKNARDSVQNKLDMVNLESFKDFVFSEHKLRQFVKNLKSGFAPGSDGISPEHKKTCM